MVSIRCRSVVSFALILQPCRLGGGGPHDGVSAVQRNLGQEDGGIRDEREAGHYHTRALYIHLNQSETGPQTDNSGTDQGQ